MISNAKECFIRFPNTEKRVEITPRSGGFLSKFEYEGVNGEIKSSKSMLIKNRSSKPLSRSINEFEKF